MRAISVPLSTIASLGFRLDTRPYMEMATETPESLRIKLKISARGAYMRHARRGLAHIKNVKKWNDEHKANGIEVIDE